MFWTSLEPRLAEILLPQPPSSLSQLFASVSQFLPKDKGTRGRLTVRMSGWESVIRSTEH